MASKGSRSRIPAEQKLRILLEVLGGTIDISELCRRVGIHPRQFYRWKKRLMSGATRLFAVEAMKPNAREARLAAELIRAKDVIAEITAENLDLKKRF